MLNKMGPVTLPLRGKLAVPGFVVTPGFEYWIGDGKTSSGRIEYSIDPNGKVKIKNIAL